MDGWWISGFYKLKKRGSVLYFNKDMNDFVITINCTYINNSSKDR